MDLVVFLFSLSYQINSHAVPMLLFSFHLHASCTPHPIHLRAVHGHTLLFHSTTAMRLHHALLPFHGYA